MSKNSNLRALEERIEELITIRQFIPRWKKRIHVNECIVKAEIQYRTLTGKFYYYTPKIISPSQYKPS